MGGLSHSHKFSVRTAPRLIERMEVALSGFKSAGFTYRGRKIGIEGLVAAMLLEFLEMTPDGQEELLRRRLPQIEAMLEAGEPNP